MNLFCHIFCIEHCVPPDSACFVHGWQLWPDRSKHVNRVWGICPPSVLAFPSPCWVYLEDIKGSQSQVLGNRRARLTLSQPLCREVIAIVYTNCTPFPTGIVPLLARMGGWRGRQEDCEVSATSACWIPVSSPAGAGENIVGKGRD